jgi:hypothetical protein
VAFDALNDRAVVVLANGRINSSINIAHTLLNRKFQMVKRWCSPPRCKALLSG